VLRLEMVDKSTGPLQTHLGPVFCYLAVQTGLVLATWTIRSCRKPGPLSRPHPLNPRSSV